MRRRKIFNSHRSRSKATFSVYVRREVSSSSGEEDSRIKYLWQFFLVLHCFMAEEKFHCAPPTFTARRILKMFNYVSWRHRDLFIASESMSSRIWWNHTKIHEHSQPPRTLWHLKSNFFSSPTISPAATTSSSGETSKEIKEKWFFQCGGFLLPL